MIIVTTSFSKSSIFNFFSFHTRTPNSSCLKIVLAKLRFRDGLVWTVGLTAEIKLRFQISLA